MGSSDLHEVLVAMQGFIGLAVIAGGAILLAVGCDRRSRLVHRGLIVGLVLWGVWFAWLAWNGQHDSPPALAMGACVAYVVLVHGRQLRGILDGEPWWPPYSANPRSAGRSR